LGESARADAEQEKKTDRSYGHDVYRALLIAAQRSLPPKVRLAPQRRNPREQLARPNRAAKSPVQRLQSPADP
jgi:hypothetical protein